MSQFILNIILFISKFKLYKNNKLKISHKHKIMNCMNSCKTYEQWLSCRRMIANFHNRFKANNTTIQLKSYSNYILDKIKM